MNVTFVEKYVPLSDMKEGDVATSKDRKSFFVCGHYYNPILKNNVKVILDVNNLHDQYSDSRNVNQPVKILKTGDIFNCAQ